MLPVHIPARTRLAPRWVGWSWDTWSPFRPESLPDVRSGRRPSAPRTRTGSSPLPGFGWCPPSRSSRIQEADFYPSNSPLSSQNFNYSVNNFLWRTNLNQSWSRQISSLQACCSPVLFRLPTIGFFCLPNFHLPWLIYCLTINGLTHF